MSAASIRASFSMRNPRPKHSRLQQRKSTLWESSYLPFGVEKMRAEKGSTIPGKLTATPAQSSVVRPQRCKTPSAAAAISGSSRAKQVASPTLTLCAARMRPSSTTAQTA